MTTPFFSIVLPTKNNAVFLELAIDSIISQTYRDWELIIVNDGSTDNTTALLQQYLSDTRVQVHTLDQSKGVPYALNLGISHATGEWVVRHDGDDVSLPSRLGTLHNFIKSRADLVLLGSDIYLCNRDGAIYSTQTYCYDDQAIRNKWLRASPFCHPSITFRRASFLQAGGYNASLRVAEDYELYFRLAQHGSIANVALPLYILRIHSQSTSWTRLNKLLFHTLLIRLWAVVVYSISFTFTDVLVSTLQFIALPLTHRHKMTLWHIYRQNFHKSI